MRITREVVQRLAEGWQHPDSTDEALVIQALAKSWLAQDDELDRARRRADGAPPPALDPRTGRLIPW